MRSIAPRTDNADDRTRHFPRTDRVPPVLYRLRDKIRDYRIKTNLWPTHIYISMSIFIDIMYAIYIDPYVGGFYGAPQYSPSAGEKDVLGALYIFTINIDGRLYMICVVPTHSGDNYMLVGHKNSYINDMFENKLLT